MPQRADVYKIAGLYTLLRSVGMRINIENDRLMAQAVRATGLPTKRAVVEEGLRLVVRIRKQARALKALKGLGWEGDLDAMRRDRPWRWP